MLTSILALAAILAQKTDPQKTVDLSWKLTEGDVFIFQHTEDTESTAVQNGKSIQMYIMRKVITYSLRITKKTEKGFDIEFIPLKLESGVTEGNKRPKMSNNAEACGKTVKAKANLQMTITSIDDADGLDKLLPKANLEHFMQCLLNEVIRPIPGKQSEIGEEWQSTYDTPLDGGVETIKSQALLKSANKGIATIEMETSRVWKRNAKATDPPFKKLSGGNGKRVIEFDTTQQRLLKLTDEYTLHGELEDPDNVGVDAITVTHKILRSVELTEKKRDK